MTNKKIGVIGSGQVAQVLGTGFLKYGYEVMIGSRDVSMLNQWRSSSGSRVQVGGLEEFAKFGEVIGLAIKGTGAEPVIKRGC